MIRRLSLVTVWLLAGHLAAFALFWLLLQVPESSTPMLLASGFLVIGIALVAAAVNAGAAGAWNMELSFGRGLAAGARSALAALVAAAVFAAIWWATGALFEWHERVRGQVDATVIARTGSPNTAWLHLAVHWLLQFVRWTVGLSLAAALLGGLVKRRTASAGRPGWLRAALHPRRLLLISVVVVLLIVLPWSHIYWRPAGLSVALEPWFVVAKLAIIAVSMAVGWALVLREGQRA